VGWRGSYTRVAAAGGPKFQKSFSKLPALICKKLHDDPSKENHEEMLSGRQGAAGCISVPGDGLLPEMPL
jgi:hypothetical protein